MNAKVGACVNDWQMNKSKAVVLVKNVIEHQGAGN